MARLRAGACVDNNRTLHRVNLTEESICDYETVFDMNINAVLPSGLTIWEDIKQDIEFFIYCNKKLWYKHYFKLKHIDPYTEKYIYLFIKPESVICNFYTWKVVGICLEEDWSQDLEDSGQIRSWLETSLNPKDDSDWVIDLQIREIERKLERLYEEDRTAYEELLAGFIERKETESSEIEGDGISVGKLNRRYQREVSRIKKERGLA